MYVYVDVCVCTCILSLSLSLSIYIHIYIYNAHIHLLWSAATPRPRLSAVSFAQPTQPQNHISHSSLGTY